jgi:hypothetical protein
MESSCALIMHGYDCSTLRNHVKASYAAQMDNKRQDAICSKPEQNTIITVRLMHVGEYKTFKLPSTSGVEKT